MVESDRIALLTPRERQCLRLVYGRRTTKEIAGTLQLAPGTVYRYLDDARRKLGARDRRQAAEWLCDAEKNTPKTTPIEFGTQSDGIGSAVTIAPVEWPEQLNAWRGLLPIRRQGALHNDLTIFARALWPIILAAALAIGFGMLASGAEVVSRLFESWRN